MRNRVIKGAMALVSLMIFGVFVSRIGFSLANDLVYRSFLTKHLDKAMALAEEAISCCLWLYLTFFINAVVIGMVFRAVTRVVGVDSSVPRFSQMIIMVASSFLNKFLLINLLQYFKEHGEAGFSKNLGHATWWYCIAIEAIFSVAAFLLVDLAINGVKKLLQRSKNHEDDAKSA